jgi:hypothetical protein
MSLGFVGTGIFTISTNVDPAESENETAARG